MASKCTYKIEEAKEIAEQRGGKCLSVEPKSELLWQCCFGHEWKARFGSIKRGGWCQKCSSSLHERFFEHFLNEKFNCKFVKDRPKWLINPETGYRLELDFYNKKHKIAFEHQGTQHYNDEIGWGKNNFVNIQKRDKIKANICKEKGIDLIIVPELVRLLPLNDLDLFIKKELEKINKIYLIKSNYDLIDVNYSEAYTKTAEQYYNNMLNEKIKEKEGKLLSSGYFGMNSYIDVQCKNGHVWTVLTKHLLKNNTWCQKCYGESKKTYDITICKEMAKLKGGDCLEIEVDNNRDSVMWICKEGHSWKANPYSIKAGGWCPYCAGKKINLKIINDIAKKKGVVCLEDKFISVKSPMRWKCKNGHEFIRSFNYLKQKINKQWCRKCKLQGEIY